MCQKSKYIDLDRLTFQIFNTGAAVLDTKPKIAVIVVNWNGWRHSRSAYLSLQASKETSWHLFIVDNASTDGSAQHLASLGENVTLIQSPRNEGFAGGCNIGIKSALSSGFEFIFLLNSDATVEYDTLSNLLEVEKLYSNTVLGCVVRYSETGKVQFFGSSVSPISGTPVWHSEKYKSHILEQKIIESDFVFGAALFAKSKMFENYGLFDERFFLNFEETDWCYRVRKSGGQCLIVRDAIVRHVGGASLGSTGSPLHSYFLERNRMLFIEKHGSIGQRIKSFRNYFRLLRNAPSSATRKALIAGLRDYIIRDFGDSPANLR